MKTIILLVICSVILLIVVRESVNARRRRADFANSLYAAWGEKPSLAYSEEKWIHIPSLYQRYKETCEIDDITWNDLGMDEIFKRINYSHSAAGEEYLYYLLRRGRSTEKELECFEKLIEYFRTHEDERVQLQLKMSELGYTGKYSLYDYMDHLDTLGKRSNKKYFFYDGLFVLFLCLFPFFTVQSIFLLTMLCVRQMICYLGEKKQIEPYLTSFSYLCRMIDVCRGLCDMEVMELTGEMEKMKKSVSGLKGIKRGASLVFTITNSRTTSNPLEVLLDYFRMIFHIDLILFNRMVTFFRTHYGEIEQCLMEMGRLETAASVCMFRASLKEGFCVPVHLSDQEKSFRLLEGYHPLLTDPVKNSIETDGGILLTGSNASGKSTFLKMVAINALLSQTIHTCMAKAYEAPFFVIYSSMSLRDNLFGGESYYIVEIKALKRILDRIGQGREMVLCFVDEVLRGTNTVERIAASTEILRSLTAKNALCFAATHDIELTDLLKREYRNYHFEEDFQNGDITFAYRLLAGKAAGRNAIRLLETIGYPEKVTEAAIRRANVFVKTGSWEPEV